MSKEQWIEAVYCFRCGARLVKGNTVEGGAIPSRSAATRRVCGTLRVVRGTVQNRPVICSLGAVGVGAGIIAVAPILLIAGNWLCGLGMGAVLISWLTDSMDETKPCKGGTKLGAVMIVSGVVVCGAAYVLMAMGAVLVVSGAGLGAWTGVKAYVGCRRARQIIVNEPLMLEGGE